MQYEAHFAHNMQTTCVKFERFGKHRLGKPDSGECVEKTLVVVVCYATSILDFANHVANGCP